MYQIIHFSKIGGVKLDIELLDFFSGTFLFRGIQKPRLANILDSVHVEDVTYHRADQIYSPQKFERKIGFVFSGECEALQTHTVYGDVSLNVLRRGETFGIVSIFSERDKYLTDVRAKKASRILFINQSDLFELVKTHSDISFNIIRFLTDRITFLNEKIATFSAANVEQKLASHIFSLYKRTNSLTFDFNKSRSAHSISAGRASLYRALDKLSDAKLITLDNKKITILDLEGLERFSK